MGEIREEFILVDKFSGAFQKFLTFAQKCIDRENNINKAAKTTEDKIDTIDKKVDKLGKTGANAGDKMQDSLNKVNKELSELATNSGQVADGGLGKLFGVISGIAGAYVGIQKLGETLQQALLENEYQVKYSIMLGDDEAGKTFVEYNRRLANQFGVLTPALIQTSNEFAKFTDNLDTVTKLNEYVNALQLNNLSVDFSQAGEQLRDAIASRSIEGLIGQYGLDKGLSDKLGLNSLLEQGKLDEFIAGFDILLEKANITGKSLEKIMEDPANTLATFKATLSNTFVSAGQQMITGIQPALQTLTALLTSDAFNKGFSLIATGFQKLGEALATFAMNGEVIISIVTSSITVALYGMATVLSFVGNNINILIPLFTTLVSVLLTYKAIIIAINIIEGVRNFLLTISAARSLLKAGATLAETAATTSATGAQIGFNAALLACPITWIVAGIAALVAILGVLIFRIVKTADTTASTLQVVFGLLYALGATIANMFIKVINDILLPINIIYKAVGTVVNFLGNVFVSPLAAIVGLFRDAFNIIAEIVIHTAKVIEPFLEVISKATGKDFTVTTKIEDFKNKFNNKANDLVNQYGGKTIIDTSKNLINELEYKSLVGAYANGRDKAGELEDKFNPNKLLDTSNIALNGRLDAMIGELKDINKNTSNDDWESGFYKHYVDLAERRNINNIKLETQSPSINMNVTNNNGATDANTIVNMLVNYLEMLKSGSGNLPSPI